MERCASSDSSVLSSVSLLAWAARLEEIDLLAAICLPFLLGVQGIVRKGRRSVGVEREILMHGFGLRIIEIGM